MMMYWMGMNDPMVMMVMVDGNVCDRCGLRWCVRLESDGVEGAQGSAFCRLMMMVMMVMRMWMHMMMVCSVIRFRSLSSLFVFRSISAVQMFLLVPHTAAILLPAINLGGAPAFNLGNSSANKVSIFNLTKRSHSSWCCSAIGMTRRWGCRAHPAA